MNYFDEFPMGIRTALENGISNKEIAEQFGISLASVNRWADGRNAPVPPARKQVLEWIKKKLNG